MFTNVKKVIAGIAGLAALALGGSAIADAASSHSASTVTTTVTTPAQAPRAFNGPAHGSAAHEDAEKAVTGSAAAKAQAAAVKLLGGGTAGDVTADFTGSGYEVTVKKADGSSVDVHLDSSFNARQGGPGDHGDHGGSPPPLAPGA